MGNRRFYIMKVEDCLTTAATTADIAERLALLQIAQSYMLLADYVSKDQVEIGMSGYSKHSGEVTSESRSGGIGPGRGHPPATG
jgi:hypothetical protein